MFLKILSIIKLIILKLRFGKRLEIKSIRQNFRLGTEIFVRKNACLSLGRVSFRTNVHLLCDLGEMHIGSRVVFNRNCIVACRHKIKIGDRCLFGPNVCVYDHDHVYTADGVSPTEFKCSEIIIVITMLLKVPNFKEVVYYEKPIVYNHDIVNSNRCKRLFCKGLPGENV